MVYDVVILGGGAAGFFAAANLYGKRVLLIEKSNKCLSKVLVSGGGRCNVTHHAFDAAELTQRYPRGNKELRGMFSRFQPKDTVHWFADLGIDLKTEEDGRMFPVTNQSSTIANALYERAVRNGTEIRLKTQVEQVTSGDCWTLKLSDGSSIQTTFFLIATGGWHHPNFLPWLAPFPIPIIPPAPSLFTFHIHDKALTELLGLSVQQGSVRVQGLKTTFHGPILITHWGLSGPAILKASAWAARILHECNYKSRVFINWVGEHTDIEAWMQQHLFSKAQLGNTRPDGIPTRLWHYLLDYASIPSSKPWLELGPKQQQRLIQAITQWEGNITGKTTYKEEFVTAGGIDLKAIDPKTMESKHYPGLFFAGEVVNVDGETGGFNFQHAWSSAWLAAVEITKRLEK